MNVWDMPHTRDITEIIKPEAWLLVVIVVIVYIRLPCYMCMPTMVQHMQEQHVIDNNCKPNKKQNVFSVGSLCISKL